MPQSIRSTTAARAAVFAPVGGAGRAELVAQRLTDAITLGLLGDGERLPSETEMARASASRPSPRGRRWRACASADW